MHSYEHHTLDWRGILIEVRYCRSWTKLHSGQPDEFDMAHIEIEAIEPVRAILPITETGYRSHFVAEHEVAEGGGALAYEIAGRLRFSAVQMRGVVPSAEGAFRLLKFFAVLR